MKCQNCQNIPHKPLTVTLALLFFFAGREKSKIGKPPNKTNQFLKKIDVIFEFVEEKN
jgi:hypothetical protein